MKRVKSYNQFIAESNKGVDEGITDIKGIMSNPIKYKKIKNNAKKYQQTKVQIALNNVDHAKKTQASTGKMDPKQKETLKAANAAKNQALKDKASAVSQRMKDLATSDALKKVVTIATTKSNLAAAETALKAADGEESKQLKIRIKKLGMQAADAQQALKDYESEGDKEVKLPGEDEKAAKAEKEKLAKEKADKAKEAVDGEITKAKAAYDKVKDGEDEKAKLQAEIKFKQAQQKKAKLDANDELFQGLGDDIGEIMKKVKALDPDSNTDTETDTDTEVDDNTPDDPAAKLEADIKAFNDNIETERTTMNKATKDLEQAKRDLKTGRGSEEKVQKLQKAIEDSKEDIAELKKKEADAKKKVAALSKPKGESFQPLEETVSEKFRRLMNNV